MNEIKLFENPEFGQVRVLEQDGEPWFVGKDVATLLGYTNPQKAIRDHVDEEDKGVNDSFTVNGTSAILINESGLYSLILRSQLPEAKAFKRWITHEVIPSIRRNGGYIAKQEDLTPEQIVAQALVVAQNIIDAKQKQIEQMTPKAEYFDALVDATLLTNFRDTAKELGVTQKDLIDFCIQQKFIYRSQAGVLRPYSEYTGGGSYFVLKDYQTGTHAGTQTLITPKGKNAIRLLINARDGRLPI